ncbi:MAG: hypothetical protein WBG37_07705 [Desulfobacterales bacterium]
MAHRVSVFAWLEGDMVHTQSSASRGKPIVKGEIQVYGENGAVLLRGSTDAEGRFSFPRPSSGPLRIEMTAGPGHKGVWNLTAAPSEATPTADQHPTEEKQDPIPKALDPFPGAAPLTADELSQILDRVLARRLSAIEEQLAASLAPTTGIREILGGLGYILGLVGLGAYIHFRQKAASLRPLPHREEKA